MLADEKDDLKLKTHNFVRLCLVDKVLREVVHEDSTTGLWLKFERPFMMKSLKNICIWNNGSVPDERM